MEFFFSHGWLCRAALLRNMCPTGNRLFLAGPDESVGGQCPVAPLPIIERSGGESPAVTLSVRPWMRFGLSLGLCSPEPCRQSTRPASHTRLSCSRANQVLPKPS